MYIYNSQTFPVLDRTGAEKSFGRGERDAYPPFPVRTLKRPDTTIPAIALAGHTLPSNSQPPTTMSVVYRAMKVTSDVRTHELNDSTTLV